MTKTSVPYSRSSILHAFLVSHPRSCSFLAHRASTPVVAYSSTRLFVTMTQQVRPDDNEKNGNKSSDRSNIKDRPKKPPLTHFLCLPLTTTAASHTVLEKSLQKFREEAISLIGSKIEDENLKRADRMKNKTLMRLLNDERALRPVGTLHLTLGVMSLREEGKLEEAKEVLRGLDIQRMLANAAGNEGGTVESTDSSVEPVVISLNAINSMHKPAQTSVLYTTAFDQSSRLLPFCQKLRSIFEDNELMVKENRPLKLHATIFNTIYAKTDAKAADREPDASVKKEPQEERKADAVDDPSNDMENEGQDSHSQNPEADGDDFENQQSHKDNGNPDPKPTPKPPNRNQKKKRKPPPVKIDGRLLIEHFKDFDWIRDLKLDRVSICKMGSRKIMQEDGVVIKGEAYEEVESVELPT